MNPFESGSRKAIPAVLIYVESLDGRILMIHRLAGEGGVGNPGDYHSGKWNGLGGKLELDESPWQAARRELKEESGLLLEESEFRWMGTLQFPNFKAHKNEDWIVYVMSARLPERAEDVSLEACAEGALHWIPKAGVPNLNLWSGDRHFISYVMSGTPFVGTIWYQGQEVSAHLVKTLT